MLNQVFCFYPKKDTYIDSYFKNKNLYSEHDYFLGFFKKAIKYRILLQFELSKIPKDSTILNAELKLYCVRNDYQEKETTFNIHPITQEWDAQSVCYTEQPNFDAYEKVQEKVDCRLWEYINFNITDFVKQWVINPEQNFGIIIKAKNEYSDESLVAISGQRNENVNYSPKLEVTAESRIKDKVYLKASPSVAILTPQFFQFNGKRCLFGGGERYLIDLAKLIKKLGYKVDVFQPSNVGKWSKTYQEIKIFGINKGEPDRDFYIELNKEFNDITSDYDYHIYFNLDMIYPYVFPQSICISHGVWWDSDDRSWWRTDKWYEYMFKGLDAVSLLVSVDTNTINWINAVSPKLKCKRVYIPNYVDLDLFKPDNARNKDYVKILYPRRLCAVRGWNICIELALELTELFDNLRFSFVGRGGSENIEKYMELIASKNPHIEYTWFEMDKMHKAYADADIVLIPSLYSEGTSLSLLEAMACGKPIIAGLVGGLTDLVLQGFNGYLIEVNKENLKSTISELVNNPMLRTEMGQNARLVSEKFSKEIWEKRWEKIILEQFPKA